MVYRLRAAYPTDEGERKEELQRVLSGEYCCEIVTGTVTSQVFVYTSGGQAETDMRKASRVSGVTMITLSPKGGVCESGPCSECKYYDLKD